MALSARAVPVWLLAALTPIFACGSDDGEGAPGAPLDAGADAAANACGLTPAGDPQELFAFEGRHVSAPSMVVLDPGDASSDRRASLAVQAFANGSSELPDDIELLRVHVGDDWPSGVGIDVPAHLVGELAVGWAEMTAAPNGRVALAWHRETIGVGLPQFQTIEPDAPPGRASVLAEKGGAVLSLAQGGGGPELRSSDVGFGVIWRDLNAPGIGPVRPMLAVVDGAGRALLGPIVVAGPDDYPGPSPVLAWNGAKYLVAAPFDECHVEDTICTRHALVLAELRPGDADGAAHLSALAAIPTLDGAVVPSSLAMASWGGETWLAWTEATDARASARVIRAVRLDEEGRPAAIPVRVVEREGMISALSLSAGEFGPVLAWAEKGDPVRPPNEPGASFVVVAQLDHEAAPRGAPIRVASTAFDTYGAPITAGLRSPSALLVLWSAHGVDAAAPNVGWLARLDCGGP